MTKRVLLLISDGIDSIVAAYLLIKKGFDISFVHYRTKLSTKNFEKVIKLINHLSELTGKHFTLYVLNYDIFHNKTQRTKLYKLHCVLCKRTMLRIADKIASMHNFDFIANGDNLGQVASQTLSNIEIVSHGVSHLVLRPLLIMDKQDVVDIARNIGTYSISTIKTGKCPFLPSNPATKSKIETVEREEENLNVNQIIEQMISKMETRLI